MNEMCKNCTRLGLSCNGTNNDTYTGCVYRVNSKRYPRYILRDGYIGTFVELTRGAGCEIPVYRFHGGDSVADDRELQNGSNDRESLRGA